MSVPMIFATSCLMSLYPEHSDQLKDMFAWQTPVNVECILCTCLMNAWIVILSKSAIYEELMSIISYYIVL